MKTLSTKSGSSIADDLRTFIQNGLALKKKRKKTKDKLNTEKGHWQM